jgi:hypothetical protein
VIARALSLLEAKEDWLLANKESISERLDESYAQIQRGEGISGDKAREMFSQILSCLSDELSQTPLIASHVFDYRSENIPLFTHHKQTTFSQQRPTISPAKSLWWNIGNSASSPRNSFRTPRLRRRLEMPQNIPLY